MCSTSIPDGRLQGFLQGTGHHHAEIIPRKCGGLLLIRVPHEGDGMEKRVIFMIYWALLISLHPHTFLHQNQKIVLIQNGDAKIVLL